MSKKTTKALEAERKPSDSISEYSMNDHVTELMIKITDLETSSIPNLESAMSQALREERDEDKPFVVEGDFDGTELPEMSQRLFRMEYALDRITQMVEALKDRLVL